MTRKEEINKSIPDVCAGRVQAIFYVWGAEWADEHPKKGLVDIDKVCEYLKSLKFQEYSGTPLERLINDFEIKELRKHFE